MNSGESFQTLCRMPAILGLLELRAARRSMLDASEEDVIAVLRGKYATANLDYRGALTLERTIGDIPDGSHHHVLRRVVRKLIDVFEPAWLAVVPRGRQFVAQAVSRDTLQCLRAAGLYDTPPSDEAMKWWDELASGVRADGDFERTVFGREGERLSYDRELARLRELGIPNQPKWVSLENNKLGYDILSYDSQGTETRSLLIEVKTTAAPSPRYFLTRREWERALEAGVAYVLHLWILPERRLLEYSAAQIADHIPRDQGSGAWDLVQVTVS